MRLNESSSSSTQQGSSPTKFWSAMPQLSVIMPVYNGENTVGAAVRSTLRSMPRDSEIVVLDDASDDGTPSQLRSIEDPRLRVLSNITNQGVARSLTHLLDSVDSEFVARMDADDLCLPWRFRLQMKLATRSPEVDFIFGGAIRFGAGVMPRSTLPIRYGHVLSMAMLPLRNPYIHPTMFARSDSLRRAGGYRTGPAEDYDLWLRAASNGAGMLRSAYPVICYRKHSNQVSGEKNYSARMLSDEVLYANYCSLSKIVYPNAESDLMWQLLVRRLQSTSSLDGVTVESLKRSLSPNLKMSKWESLYLEKWLKKAVG